LLDENDRPITAETATKRHDAELAADRCAHLHSAPARAQENAPSPTDTARTIIARRFPQRLPARAFSRPRSRGDLARGTAFSSTCCRAAKAAKSSRGTIWRDKPRLNIPGSVWLPDTGYGALAAATEDYLRRT
jgi:hypothetical protein